MFLNYKKIQILLSQVRWVSIYRYRGNFIFPDSILGNKSHGKSSILTFARRLYLKNLVKSSTVNL